MACNSLYDIMQIQRATREASIDNMAHEGSLLSVIVDLLKILISFSLLKLHSALATVTGQFSIIRSAINTLEQTSARCA